MTIDDVRGHFGGQVHRATVRGRDLWMDFDNASAFQVARSFAEMGARLITVGIDTTEEASPRLMYYFDVHGGVYTASIAAWNRQIETITPLYPLARPLERELSALHRVVFIPVAMGAAFGGDTPPGAPAADGAEGVPERDPGLPRDPR